MLQPFDTSSIVRPSKPIIKEKVTSSTEFERSKFGLSSHKQRCETVEKKLKISYISFAKRNIPLERQRNSSRTAGISSEAILFFFSLYPNEVAVQSDQALPLQSVCLFSLVQNCEIYLFINFYDLSPPIERCNILGQHLFFYSVRAVTLRKKSPMIPPLKRSRKGISRFTRQQRVRNQTCATNGTPLL